MSSSSQFFKFKSSENKKGNILQEKKSYFSNQNKIKHERRELQSSINTQRCIVKDTIRSRNGKVLGSYFMNKRQHCFKCDELVHKKSMKIHSKYYCGAHHDEKEWKLCGSLALCKKCNRTQDPDSIEFHVGYLCQKRQIHVQCFYCSRIFADYRGLLKHTNSAHHKKHRYQDLISILPPAESLFSVQGPVKVVKNFFSNYLNTTEESNSKMSSSANVCLQVRNKTTHKCSSCGKILVGTHAYADHVNTQCESENLYICFYCPFKAEYAYQVLDHMEVDHSKKFNTFDLIQAKITGIIPIMEVSSTESVPEDNEVEFANHQLFEPFLPEAQIFQKEINPIKVEQNKTFKQDKRGISEKNNYDSTENVSGNTSQRRKHFNLTKDVKKNRVDMVKENGVKKIEFMRKISLKVSKKRVKIGKNVISGKKGKRNSIIKMPCSRCQELVIPGDMGIHMKYHCGKKVMNDWILKSGKALCLRCNKIQSSSTIAFHVRYICERKVFSVQCFYCPKIATSYKSLLVHMSKGHNKVHYYQDLMTILPESESISRNPQNSLGRTGEQKVVKHPYIYDPPIYNNYKSDPTSSKLPSAEDLYYCFYCTYKNKAAFKVLDHMEETHTKRHNMYDLLKTKMAVRNFNK